MISDPWILGSIMKNPPPPGSSWGYGTAIKVHGYGHAGTWVGSCRDMGTVHGGVAWVRGTVRGAR